MYIDYIYIYIDNIYIYIHVTPSVETLSRSWALGATKAMQLPAVKAKAVADASERESH